MPESRWPWLVVKWLSYYCKEYNFFEDIREEYCEIVSKDGRISGEFWLLKQVTGSFIVFIKYLLVSSYYLQLSFFRTSLRNIFNNRWFSLISLLGLSVGIASCGFIMLWSHQELGINSFFRNSENIYRIISVWENQGVKSYGIKSSPMLPQVSSGVTENLARLKNLGDRNIKANGKRFYQSGIYLGDSSLFQIFHYRFTKGSVRDLESDEVVISEAASSRYFGKLNPLGRMVTLDNRYSFKVVGVIGAVDSKTDMKIDFLFPMELLKNYYPEYYDSWDGALVNTYVSISEGQKPVEVAKRLYRAMDSRNDKFHKGFLLQNIRDIGLKKLDGTGGRKNNIYILNVLGIMILGVAFINYMGITVVRSIKRAQEMFIRKILGASLWHSVCQLMWEASILVSVAAFTGFLIILFSIPFFNGIMGSTLKVLDIFSSGVIFKLVSVVLGATLVSTLYSSWIGGKGRGILFFKGKNLITLQFVVSVVLLVSSLGIFKQQDFLNSKDLGFRKDKVVVIKASGIEGSKFKLFKNSVEGSGFIESATGVSNLPSYGTLSNTGDIKWKGRELLNRPLFGILYVTEGFLETFKIAKVSGNSRIGRQNRGVVLTSMGASLLPEKAMPGDTIWMDGDEYTVSGIVKDFHCFNLYGSKMPLIISYRADKINWIAIRYNGEEVKGVINFLKQKWGTFMPEFPFNYKFMEDLSKGRYRSIQQGGRIFGVFALVATVISCMGLLALISIILERRTKEIGVRRVMGANTLSLFFLLSKGIFGRVIVANILAWPLGWLIAESFFENLVYRKPTDISVFLVSIIITTLSALLTVTTQTYKGVSADPIKTLKCE